jgi:hypothetical protein
LRARDEFGYAIDKNVACAQSAGDIQALLPPLVLLPFPLAQLARPAQILKNPRVFVVLVVEVQFECIPDPARNTAPSSLPLVGPGSLPRTPHAGLGAGEVVARAEAAAAPSRILDGLDYIRAKGVDALHAEPGPDRDTVQINAVCVVRGITAVAKQQHLLVSPGVAHRTAAAGELRLFRDVIGPCARVELGDLLLVLDMACGQILACKTENANASADSVLQN